MGGDGVGGRVVKRIWFTAIVVTVVCGASCRTEDSGQRATTRQVTAYVSADRPFSEPVMQEYEQRSGVHVNVVYDTEETKSTGLANRLLAEKARPQADVFWSNEPVRTLVLKSRGVLAAYRSPSAQGIPSILIDPEGYWTGFSARIRVIAYNTKLVKPDEAPQSVFDLADARWRNQVAIADPRFGSTSFHVAALYALAGDEKMDDFFRRLKANGVRIVDGNSVVRDMVARGDVKVGLTDTDDVNVAIEDHQPIAMVLPDKNGLGVPVMPNMVSLLANSPHGDEGRKLIDYLLSPDVERRLAQSEAVQIPLHAGVPGPKNIPAIETFKPMTLDYAQAASRVESGTQRVAMILGL
jgi:iron(III) transport system substrate-binding protein